MEGVRTIPRKFYRRNLKLKRKTKIVRWITTATYSTARARPDHPHPPRSTRHAPRNMTTLVANFADAPVVIATPVPLDSVTAEEAAAAVVAVPVAVVVDGWHAKCKELHEVSG